MAYCNKCGNQLPEGAVFCTSCGAPAVQLKKTEMPPPPPAEAAPVEETPQPPVPEAPIPLAEETPQPVPEAPVPLAEETPQPLKETLPDEAPAPFEEDAPAEPEGQAEPPAYSAPPPAYGETPPVYAPPMYGPPPSYGPPPAYGPPPSYGEPLAAPGRNTFINSFLGIIVLAFFMCGWPVTGIILSPYFFTAGTITNLLQQFFLYGAIAFAVTLSVRAKGPDLSIGYVAGLSAMIIALLLTATDSLILGIAVALVACAVIGLLNGALTTYLRIPAIILTLITGMIAYGICFLISNAMSVTVPAKGLRALATLDVIGIPIGWMALFVVAFIAAFLLILLTKLGVPTYKREKKGALSYMFAYMASALIASLVGLLLLSRTGAANISLGSGYEPFILIVFACVAGSRVLDNRIAPALYAIAPVIFYVFMKLAMNLLAFPVYLQTIIDYAYALIFVAVMYIARNFGTPKPAEPDPS